jgi:GMP synthase (glutamine-hydrolysing)
MFTNIHKQNIFRGLSSKQSVLLTHGDSVDRVAEGFKAVANSGPLVAAISNDSSRIFYCNVFCH